MTVSSSSRLHLPDLTIKGFRGIEDLTIPRLGRVTLLVGKNGIGKTTVLEAVQAYAARGHRSILTEILGAHDEMSSGIDEDGDEVAGPDWPSLFHRRDWSPGVEAVIGPTSGHDQLRIQVGPLTEGEQGTIWEARVDSLAAEIRGASPQVLRAKFRGYASIIGISTGLTAGATPRVMPWRPRHRRPGLHRSIAPDDNVLPAPITCERVGPGLLGNVDLARYLDRVALSEAQEQAVNALRLIFGSEVRDVAIVGRQESPYLGDLRMIVKLNGLDRPVPLRSLGDGALRMFAVALALANSVSGFLLIDEAENGLHYSVQREFWRMVLQTAERHNVQVLATTHGSDCIAGFALAAAELEGIDGLLTRIERDDDGLRAVDYTEQGLKGAALQHIEVR